MPPQKKLPIGSPALRLVQAYELGVSDYAPAAAVERLDAGIKHDRLTVAQMSTEALRTRAEEQAGYHAASEQLRLMGAPTPVTSIYASDLKTLAAPVAISDRAKEQLPGDPAAQQVWSTLDEAEQLAPTGVSPVIPWLKLSHGRDAVWAYHLGNLSAVIRASIPGDPNYLPLIHGAGALAESAPPGCPPGLIEALKTIAARANENTVTLAALNALDAVIQSVFEPAQAAQPAAAAPSSPNK